MNPFDVAYPNPIEEMGPLLWVVILVVVIVLAALTWAIIRSRRR